MYVAYGFTLENVKLFMKHKVTQVPIGKDEQYYKVLITLPVDETSSLTGSFVVTAENSKQARTSALIMLYR